MSNVYLVEKEIKGKLESIAIKSNPLSALKLFKEDDTGVMTVMTVNRVYGRGIGVCRHWHILLTKDKYMKKHVEDIKKSLSGKCAKKE